MTVSTVVNHEQYTGNGVTTVFPYRFRILKGAHMVVTVADKDGLITTLILGTDYTITGVGLISGGNVILSRPLEDAWSISLDRDLPAIQETDFRNQGRFFPETHEDAFDYLTMLMQKSLSWFSLALRKPSFIARYFDAQENRISNLADPLNDQDAINSRTLRDYVEKAVAGVTGGFGWFIQLGSGAIYRTFQDKLRDTLSVRDFGAKGDGVTDDSPAIMRAITAAGGKKLIFPAGKYRCLSYLTLTSNTYLCGEGYAEIYLDPAMTLGASFGGLARAVYGMSVSNITLENIAFNSSKSAVTQSITVAFLSVSGLKVKGCTFKNFGDATHYAQGMIAFQTTDVYVENNTFQNCSGDGMALSNNCLRYVIKGNVFSGNGDWGCALVEGSNYGSVSDNIFLNNKSTATGVDRCSFVQFTANVMLNNEHGVRVCEFSVSTDKCEHISVIGNNIDQSNYGVSIENMKLSYGNFTVSGNTITNSAQQGIQVINTMLGTITGNTIYSSANSSILLQVNNADKTTGMITISGNTMVSSKRGIQEVRSAGSVAINMIVGNNMREMSVRALDVSTNSKFLDASSSTQTIDISGPFNMPAAYSSPSASAGGTALPVNAQGFIPIYLDGTVKKIPYYNA